MPPISFVGAEPGTWDTGGSFSVPTPSDVRDRDTMFLIVAMPIAGVLITVDASATFEGWTLVQTVITAAYRIYLLRRDVADAIAEPTSHTGTFSGGVHGIAALLAFREVVDPTRAVGAANDSAASTNHTSPSQMPIAYSGMYVGVVMLDGVAASSSTIPAGTTLILRADIDAYGVAVYGLLPESTVATGTKVSTSTGAANGTAASFLVDAKPAVGQGLSFSVSPIGAPGLAEVGI